MKDFSYVMSSHPSYVESLYNDFLKDPASVDGEWKKFFEGFDFALSKINGQYFSAFRTATIGNTHIENLTLTPTTIDDFKLTLGSLP